MTRKILALALLALSAGPTASAFAKGGSSKSPPPAPPATAPTHDEEAANFIQSVLQTRAGQSASDAEASVKKLTGFWKDAGVSDGTKASIPGLLAWYAHRKQPSVALAGISGLVAVGKGQGSQKLVHVLEALLVTKDTPAEVTTAAFAGLKSMADPDASVTSPLLQFLGKSDPQIVAQTAGVFAGYGAAPGPAKKHLFEQTLAAFEGMAAAGAKTDDKPAVDKWAAVQTPALAELGALSKQSFPDLAAARKWLVDHGHDAESWK
jgi:hypothetical protein